MAAEIAIVVAIDDKRGIGKDGKLPWPGISEDRDRFIEETMGHPVIMGRKTYDSIRPKYRPLVGRPNIVVTRSQDLEFPGCNVAHTFEDAITIALTLAERGRICVIGGAEIYKEAISLTDILFLTRIEGDFNADTFFPEYSEQFPHLRRTQSSSHNGINYTFEDLTRIP